MGAIPKWRFPFLLCSHCIFLSPDQFFFARASPLRPCSITIFKIIFYFLTVMRRTPVQACQQGRDRFTIPYPSLYEKNSSSSLYSGSKPSNFYPVTGIISYSYSYLYLFLYYFNINFN